MAVNFEPEIPKKVYDHNGRFGTGMNGPVSSKLTRTEGDVIQYIKPQPKVVEKVVEKVVTVDRPVTVAATTQVAAPVQYVDRVVV